MPGRMRDPGPGAKDEALDERLRDARTSEQASARVADAAASTSRSDAARSGGPAGDYDDWTLDDLRRKAADVGVEGGSRMGRSELLAALRRY